MKSGTTHCSFRLVTSGRMLIVRRVHLDVSAAETSLTGLGSGEPFAQCWL